MWSGIRIQIAGLIRIRMSVESVPKCCGFILLSTWIISPSVVKTGWWLWEMLINLLKSHAVGKKIKKKWFGMHTRIPDQRQKLITSRRSLLAHAYHVWSTSVSAFVSYPAHRMTDRQTDRRPITLLCQSQRSNNRPNNHIATACSMEGGARNQQSLLQMIDWQLYYSISRAFRGRCIII